MKPFISLAEKTLATYVQVFLALVLVGPTLNVSIAQSAAMAAIPSALTVLANGLGAMPILSLPWAADVAYRTVRTYAASFLGLLLAQPAFKLDHSVLQAAIVGSIPAALAVVKGAVASRVGDPNSAALLPASVDTRSTVF